MSEFSKPGLRVDIGDFVARVTLDRPPVNAFTLQMYQDLGEMFVALGDSDQVRCIVLQGAGSKAFSAGFDFKLFAADRGEDDPKRPLILRRMLESVRRCPLPVIGAISGPALGAGCVLAAACDICVATGSAVFSLPEVDFDRVGGSAYVGSRVTKGFVRYMAFTGRKVSAAEAHAAGLVDFVMSGEDFLPFVNGLAIDIAAKAAHVLRHTKRALNRIENLPIDEGYEVEQTHSIMARAGLHDAGS